MIKEQPYIISYRTAALAIAQQVVIDFTLPNDCDFRWEALRSTGNTNVFMQLRYTSGNNLSNDTYNMALIGAGTDGYTLPKPALIKGNSGIQCIMNNLSGGALTYVEVILIGTKIYHS